jgi:hypothetical protein
MKAYLFSFINHTRCFSKSAGCTIEVGKIQLALRIFRKNRIKIFLVKSILKAENQKYND